MNDAGCVMDEAIAAVRYKIRAAQQAQADAAEGSRALVQRLAAKGLTGRDTAKVLGVSPQRVSQLRRAGTGSTHKSRRT